MKPILAAIMAISFVSLLAGAGAFTFISSTFASGEEHSSKEKHEFKNNLDLKLSDNDESWRNGVTATWVLSNMKPGDSTSGVIGFRSTKEAHNLNISASFTIDEGVPVEPETNPHNSADDFAKKMIITEMRYYGRGNLDLLTTDNYDSDYKPNPENPGPMVKDMDADGKITLYDLKAGVGVKPPEPSRNTWLNMTIKFDQNAGNDFQGDRLNMTMIFTLT